MKDKIKTKALPNTFKGSVSDLSQLNLDGSVTNKSIIEVMRVGDWSHPVFGDISITQGRLERFVNNFDDGLRKAIAAT